MEPITHHITFTILGTTQSTYFFDSIWAGSIFTIAEVWGITESTGIESSTGGGFWLNQQATDTIGALWLSTGVFCCIVVQFSVALGIGGAGVPGFWSRCATTEAQDVVADPGGTVAAIISASTTAGATSRGTTIHVSLQAAIM
jgi:hypothetical protein